MRLLRAALLSPLVVFFMAVSIPLLLTLPPPLRVTYRKYISRLGLLFTGIRPRIIGTLAPGPSLVVSNHCSYFDILALQQLGDLRFTPKLEIARWPLIGQMTTGFGAIYLDRDPRRARDAGSVVLTALKTGARVSVFPEGTTNDGRHLLPFKSALFSLAERWEGSEGLCVQPVVLRYRGRDGSLLPDHQWKRVAWYADMTLAPHLFNALRGLGLSVDIVCLPPLEGGGKTRRQIAAECHDAIAAAL